MCKKNNQKIIIIIIIVRNKIGFDTPFKNQAFVI